jgi:hypothetical protein
MAWLPAAMLGAGNGCRYLVAKRAAAEGPEAFQPLKRLRPLNGLNPGRAA